MESPIQYTTSLEASHVADPGEKYLASNFQYEDSLGLRESLCGGNAACVHTLCRRSAAWQQSQAPIVVPI